VDKSQEAAAAAAAVMVPMDHLQKNKQCTTPASGFPTVMTYATLIDISKNAK
jgi:hypothetical protein